MERIKSGGQKQTKLEVFLQDGRYGVMRNGKITCPARFKQVKRLQENCGFFALGIYTVHDKSDFSKLTELTTIIDKSGQDLQVKLYGAVSWKEDYFCGEWKGKTGLYVNCWDPKGNSYYYDTYPDFQKVAGVEIGFSYEHESRSVSCMKLRISTGKVSPRFNICEMFYNRDIIIARDYLVVKKDKNHSYRIRGYLGDSLLVESEERYGYQQIMLDGKKGLFYDRLPTDTIRVVNLRKLGLYQVETQ